MGLKERAELYEKGLQSAYFEELRQDICEETRTVMACCLDQHHEEVKEDKVLEYAAEVKAVQDLMPGGTLRSRQVLALILRSVLKG